MPPSSRAPEYPWAEVAMATGGLCPERRLGAGASGAVYGGYLREGTEAAFKVLDAPVGTGFEEEVRLLSRCRHPNVVLLLGFAREPPREEEEVEEAMAAQSCRSDGGSGRGSSSRIPRRCALVYELLCGGDLYRRLQSPMPPFLWFERLRAAIDVARGLAHLHKHRPEIFHRDIKSQNILFGADGRAKIGDFGLACMPGCKFLHVSSDVAGTLGYVDPKYMETGIVTEASEVYSWGMVLIELLTSRPPAVLLADGRSCAFLADELRLWEDHAKHRVLRQLDAVAQWHLAAAAGLATLALLCIHIDSDRRPSFLEATAMLQAMFPACPAGGASGAQKDGGGAQGPHPANAGKGIAQDQPARPARPPQRAAEPPGGAARQLPGAASERGSQSPPARGTRCQVTRSKSVPAADGIWPMRCDRGISVMT